MMKQRLYSQSDILSGRVYCNLKSHTKLQTPDPINPKPWPKTLILILIIAMSFQLDLFEI
jgi:hypothetical protein